MFDRFAEQQHGLKENAALHGHINDIPSLSLLPHSTAGAKLPASCGAGAHGVPGSSFSFNREEIMSCI
jgi:hypothetical protein